MKFAEIDVFGVYVAPIAPMMVAAWVILVLLRGAAIRAGFAFPVWHPALFTGAAYVIILSAEVILAAAR